MNTRNATLGLCFAVLVASAAVAQTDAQPVNTTPGELRTHATLHSIGIEWDITGDSDHDATCKVQYRAKGTEARRPALPLFRVDLYGWYADTKADKAYNVLAGSLLFLQPGTAYEVKLELTDPDGGAKTETFAIKTRPIPALPTGGRTLHVMPGAGGGKGSADDPFKGLAAAQAEAKPGDILLLRPRNYGTFKFEKPGEPGRYVAWKAAGDGEAVFEHVEVAASHLWFEGLTLKRGESGNGLKAIGAPTGVVVSRNTFTGFHYSILLSNGSSDWHITDNVIVSDNDPTSGVISGEGVEMNQSSGHVVCYNRISRTTDGVSYCQRNCDIDLLQGTFAEFVEAVGIEKHGRRVRKEEIFEKRDIPDSLARVEPHVLTLKPGCNAIDAGDVLPNVNEDFVGKAPDLGAHEFSTPLPRYGPRERPGK